jgi:uncharacterized membrane protein
VPAWAGADTDKTYEELRRRLNLVKTVFNWRDDAAALAALRSLQVRYIFVGDLERRTYPSEALGQLRRALPVEYSNGDTFIARVPD